MALFATNAAPVAAQPLPANASAPQIDIPRPIGARRGSTVELTISGKNLTDPVCLGLSFPATATFMPAKTGAAPANSQQVRLEIPSDTPLGLHTVRLATKRGISNLRFLCIDDLPEIQNQAGISAADKAQRIGHPAVVTGKAEKEASDYYRFGVAANTRLAFEVIGRRLGSAFDPQITLFDAKTGKELPGGHNNDAAGLQTDARLIYTFKTAGDYLIEIRDTLWRGGDDFWYRLRIGDFPCATTPYPLAARRGTQKTVGFAGPVGAPPVPFEVIAPADTFLSALALTPTSASGLSGWPVFLAVSDLEERTEQEPNNDLAHANRIPVPCAVSARLLESNDVDCFTFAAKKGQRLDIEVQSLEWNSPTEVYMVVKDAKGTQLAAGNPQIGQTIDFTAPADGDFTVVIEHLLTWNGPAEAYRLIVKPRTATFDLGLGSDRLEIPQGGVGAIPVTLVRKEYTGPVELEFLSPAGIHGRGKAPAGALAATLFVQAAADLPAGAYPVQVRGSAVISGKMVQQPARIRAQVMAALGGLPYPPPNLLDRAEAGVTEKAPFAIRFRLEGPEAVRGKPISVIVELASAKAAESDIKLASVGLPAKITASVPVLKKGQASVKGTIHAANDAPVGDHEFTILATASIQGRDVQALAPPATLSLKAKSEAVPPPAKP
jgi:hypothetical protein